MKPLPQQLCDRAKLLASIHPLQTVAEILGKHPAMISRIRARGWKEQRYPRKPMPTDFAIQVRHMNHEELKAHYRAGSCTVTRWRKEIGL